MQRFLRHLVVNFHCEYFSLKIIAIKYYLNWDKVILIMDINLKGGFKIEAQRALVIDVTPLRVF